jgi:hypothetical protein
MMILQAQMQSAEKIMLERFRIKVMTLQARGSGEDQMIEYLKSDAGRIEWAAMVNEIKKMVAGTISRVADLGYFIGFGGR